MKTSKLLKILGMTALVGTGTLLPYTLDKKETESMALAGGITALPLYAWVKYKNREENKSEYEGESK